MARGKKTGGRNFLPGNPGRPKTDPNVRLIKRLTTDKIIEGISRIVHMTVDELKQLATNPQATGLELALGKILVEAIKTGDHQRIEFLMNRTVGKVTEKIEHKMPVPTVIKLTGEDAALVLGADAPESDVEE